MRYCAPFLDDVFHSTSFDQYSPELDVWASLINELGLQPTLSSYEVWLMRYPTMQSISTSADQLKAHLKTSLPGREEVISGHSMGGLVSRQDPHSRRAHLTGPLSPHPP